MVDFRFVQCERVYHLSLLLLDCEGFGDCFLCQACQLGVASHRVIPSVLLTRHKVKALLCYRCV